jgi:hypothetical protein
MSYDKMIKITIKIGTGYFVSDEQKLIYRRNGFITRMRRPKQSTKNMKQNPEILIHG